MRAICHKMCYNLIAKANTLNDASSVSAILPPFHRQRRKAMKPKKYTAPPDEIHLIKKKRKGLLRIIFSRFGVIALLFLLQVGALVAVFVFLEDQIEWFAFVMAIFIFVMLFHLFKNDMDATAKLTWLFLMMLFPIQVSVMLWITEKHIGHRKLERRLKTLNDESNGKLTQEEEVLKDPGIISSGTDDLCRYLNRSGHYPLYRNTQVTFFPLGEDKFEAMLEELKKAEKFIFMEYFIIDEGMMWGRILKILAEKAAQGVEVRVMYDGMCEMSTLTGDYPRRMSRLGIKCKAFSKLQPFVSTHYNYRDHRKILVIDGKVAFNGGVNLADEYINHIDRFGHWKDTALMLKGDAAESFTLMFLRMWNLSETNVQWDEYLHRSVPAPSDGFVMPYADSPLDEYKVGESVYMDIIYRAKKYVHIMTPYLILDNELETALKFAAQRGVDVKLILPGIPDKKSAYALAKSYYKYLIEAGVKIYEYTPGFVHAKVFVSDDIKGVTGTINLDYRSLYHHFECATYLYGVSCIADMEEDFQNTLTYCREVTPETIKNEKLGYKLRGALMRIFAPLM